MNVSGAAPYDIEFNDAPLVGGFISANAGAAAPNTIRTLVMSSTSQTATNAAGSQTAFVGVSETAATLKAGNGTLVWSASSASSGPVSFNVGTYINSAPQGSAITQVTAASTLSGFGMFGSIVSAFGTIQTGSTRLNPGVLTASGNITLSGSTSVVPQLTGNGQLLTFTPSSGQLAIVPGPTSLVALGVGAAACDLVARRRRLA